MMIFMFESEREPDTYGFSIFEDGGNLPQDLNPWTLVKVKKYREGQRTGVDVGEMLGQLENQGFCVVKWG